MGCYSSTNSSALLKRFEFQQITRAPDSPDILQLHPLAPLPVGWRDRPCPKCGGHSLSGALITESADDFDPNLICLRCGHWWD
jgi:hypothetical protein